jgi:hypothetical protein
MSELGLLLMSGVRPMGTNHKDAHCLSLHVNVCLFAQMAYERCAAYLF